MRLRGGDVDGVGDGACCRVVEMSLGGGVVDWWCRGGDVECVLVVVVVWVVFGFGGQP